MSLRTHIEELAPNCALVTFEGTFTLGMDLRLADSHVRGLLDKGVCRLAFDMTSVTQCDSAGLGLLVHTFGLTKEQDGGFRLFGVSSNLARVLKMTTTDTFLPMDTDRASALSALNC